MRNFILKTLIIFGIIAVYSCAQEQIRPPYIISDYPDIQYLEEFDHQYCESLKLNFDSNSNIESKLYWHCRISFAKFRLEIKPNFPWQMEFNQKISDLLAKISIKISRTRENIIQQEINKIDEKDHKKCLSLGYNPDSKDKSVMENYYTCRKNIIELNYSELPYNNSDYEAYQNKSYDLNYIVDRRIREAINKDKEILEKYPDCALYKTTSIDFEKCTESIDKYGACIKDSNIKIINKENDEKLICQRQAYVHFSDDMIKNEDRNDIKIQKRNSNSDRDNKNNFSGLGIDEDEFAGKEKKIEIKKQNLLKKIKIEDNNNYSNIYSKQEISKLRRDFIANCTTIINERMSLFIKELRRDCEEMKYKPTKDTENN